MSRDHRSNRILETAMNLFFTLFIYLYNLLDIFSLFYYWMGFKKESPPAVVCILYRAYFSLYVPTLTGLELLGKEHKSVMGVVLINNNQLIKNMYKTRKTFLDNRCMYLGNKNVP